MITKFFNTTEKKVRLSEYCDAQKPNLKKSLLLRHRISEETLNYMVELFFGSVPAFKSISRTDVDNYMVNKPCNGPVQIDFTVNFSATADNNEIVLVVPDIDQEFSIAFFEAIIAKYNPDSFHFSKAVSDKHKDGNTIVFRVIKKIGGNDTIVYCADLSGMP